MAYTLKSQKGLTVRFVPFDSGVIEKESESYHSAVTTNPIEAGSEINDHVNNAAGALMLSGTIVGGEGAVTELKAMRESRELITYTGVTRMNNLVFTSLKFERTYKNSKGASFSATLRQVQTLITTPETGDDTMTMQDVGKSDDSQLSKTSSAGQQTISYQSVSSASAAKLIEATPTNSSAAPTIRITGGYDGLTS